MASALAPTTGLSRPLVGRNARITAPAAQMPGHDHGHHDGRGVTLVDRP